MHAAVPNGDRWLRAGAASHIAPPSKSKRLPVLDGIRGVAIALVLLCHAVFEMKPASHNLSRLVSVGGLSWSGVDLFFVLSGFLIGGILLDWRDSPNYCRTFYARRALRILPLYSVLLVIFFARFYSSLHLPAWAGKFSEAPIPWFSYLTFTQNIFMAGAGTFGVGAVAATWSLAVEEQFYLAAPLMVRILTRRRLACLMIGVIIGSPLLRVFLHFSFPHGNFADYVLTPCRADALSVGALVAVGMRVQSIETWMKSHLNVIRALAVILFSSLFCMTFVSSEGTSTLMVSMGYSMLAGLYGSILLLAVISRGWTSKVLSLTWLKRLGGLAYFTYLFHLPAMEFCRRLLGIFMPYSTIATQFWGGLVGVGITILLASLSWRVFEGPLVRFGQKRFSY